MNIYYKRKQRLDIPRFWREIGKMSIAPLAVGAASYYALSFVDLNRPLWFVSGAVVFTLVYLPCCWIFVMNKEERRLVTAPLLKIKHKLP